MPTQPLARRHALMALAALAVAGAAPLRAAEPLRIALAPFLSPAALLQAHRPLREHLERTLQRPVEMLTAKDFRSLMESTRRREQDVVMLPAHLARLAMLDWQYQQVAGTLQTLDVLVLVKDAGPVRAPADLRGRAVGMLDALALTATVGRQWLAAQGLAEGTSIIEQSSINSALYALDREEVAAIVAGRTQLHNLPPSTPRGERVLATLRDIPGPVYVARPGLPADELAELRRAMLSFQVDPALQGSAANSAPKLLDAATLAALDPYVEIARRALGGTR